MKEVNNFINTLRSECTRRNYQNYIEGFLNYKGITEFESFKEATGDDYFEYKNYLATKCGNAENSLKLKFMAISSFYNYLTKNPKYNIKENVIKECGILTRIKNISNPAHKTWLTSDERQLFLEECKNPREKAICVIFLNTAVRVSELINLKLSKYTRYQNKDGENVSYVYFTRKGGKMQKLYFNAYVTRVVEEYLKVRKDSECDNLFVSNCGKPMSTQSIDRTINKLAKKAGINKKISAHSLRRTVATDMNKQGIPLKGIQLTLGHNSISTTGLYIQNLEEDTEDLMMNYVVAGE